MKDENKTRAHSLCAIKLNKKHIAVMCACKGHARKYTRYTIWYSADGECSWKIASVKQPHHHPLSMVNKRSVLVVHWQHVLHAVLQSFSHTHFLVRPFTEFSVCVSLSWLIQSTFHDETFRRTKKQVDFIWKNKCTLSFCKLSVSAFNIPNVY